MLINFTRCGEKGTLLHCWWECKLVQPLWRTVWRFLKKLEIELPSGTSLVVQWLILRPPSAGDPGSILGQGTRSHMLQPRPGTAKEILKKNTKKTLPYDPAIPLLGIHTEETRTERDTHTPMFIAALFIIAWTWKQPRCPSADNG